MAPARPATSTATELFRTFSALKGSGEMGRRRNDAVAHESKSKRAVPRSTGQHPLAILSRASADASMGEITCQLTRCSLRFTVSNQPCMADHGETTLIVDSKGLSSDDSQCSVG